MRPEWVGQLVTGPETTIPSFVYDQMKLPSGFAVFTTKPHCDIYLEAMPNSKSQAIRLCQDMKFTHYQGWAMKTISNFLREKGKELSPAEIAQSMFFQMPVLVNPKGPFRRAQGASFVNWMSFASQCFSMEQIEESKEGAKYEEMSRVDKFALAQYSKEVNGDAKKKLAYFYLISKNAAVVESEMFDESSLLGTNAFITMTHFSAEDALEEARNLIGEANAAAAPKK
jgi:hypothetical protein